MKNSHSSLFLPTPNRGGGLRASAAVNPAALASGAAGDRGKRERGLWGTDPLPHLELGWRAEAARRERAAVVGGSCGGGAREAREGAGGGGWSCEAMATPRTSLNSRGMAVARRWGSSRAVAASTAALC